MCVKGLWGHNVAEISGSALVESPHLDPFISVMKLPPKLIPNFIWNILCMLCARIVVHGKSFLKAVSPYSAQVFNVNKELRLTKSRVGHFTFFASQSWFYYVWYRCLSSYSCPNDSSDLTLVLSTRR